MYHTRAFTLIELTAVLAIIATIMGVVAVSMRTPYQRAKLQETVERIAFADRQMRGHAQRFHRPCELVIDLEDGKLEVVEDEESGAPTRSCTFSGGVRIDRVFSSAGRAETGRIGIACSPEGLTETYAVRLVGGSGQQRWLLFAGVTGQMTEMANEQEVLTLFYERLGADDGAEGG